jgi:hypothetical protein
MPTWIEWIVANYQALIAIVVALLTGAIGIAMLIPGDQPEKALQGVVDFIAKFSKK